MTEYCSLNIVATEGIRSGKPRFDGSRLAISDVLELLVSGDSIDEILRNFPQLSVRHLELAVAYAVDSVNKVPTHE